MRRISLCGGIRFYYLRSAELLQRNKVTWKKVSKNMTYSTCLEHIKLRAVIVKSVKGDVG